MRGKIIIAALLYSLAVFATEHRVQLLDSYTGNKYIKGYVNGVEVIFTLDTGCSSFTLNKKIFNKLVQNGSVSKNDLQDVNKAIYADGYEHSVREFVVSEFRLGDYVFHDVLADIGVNDSPDASPLLGQVIFTLMKYYRIEDDFLYFEPRTESDIKALTFAEHYGYDSKHAKQVADYLLPLYQKNELSYKYLYIFSTALINSSRGALASECLEKMMQMPTIENKERLANDYLFSQLEIANGIYDKGNYTEAIEQYKAVAEIAKNNKTFADIYGYALYDIAYAYLQLQDLPSAVSYTNRYLNHLLKPLGKTIASLASSTANVEERAAKLLFDISRFYEADDDEKNAAKYRKYARNAGYKGK